jgi:hypothetical protein
MNDAMISRDDDAQKKLFTAMRGIAFRSASSGMWEAAAAVGLFVNDGALASLVVALWADESLLTRMRACEYSGVLSTAPASASSTAPLASIPMSGPSRSVRRAASYRRDVAVSFIRCAAGAIARE